MVTTRVNDADVVVRDFFDALVSGSTRRAADLLAEDVWWENVGLPVIRGKRAVTRAIAVMNRRCRFGVRMHHLAVEAPRDPSDPRSPTVILTERTDILSVGPLHCEFWVCGRLEVLDGEVCGWKDYFSLADMALGAVRGVVRMLPGSGR